MAIITTGVIAGGCATAIGTMVIAMATGTCAATGTECDPVPA
jgi:hypothetical protein